MSSTSSTAAQPTPLLAAARVLAASHAVDGLEILLAPGRAQLRAVDRARRRRSRSCARRCATGAGTRSAMSARPPTDRADLHAIFGMDETAESASEPVIEVERTVATDDGLAPDDGAERGRRVEIADVEIDDDVVLDPAEPSTESSGRDVRAPRPRRPASATGITRPSRRGSSSRFLTDVIVDMGLVARERVDEAIASSRSLGHHARARAARRGGALSPDGLARALAERYGLDHLDLGVFQVDMGAANLVTSDGRQALPGGAGRVRRQAHAAGRDGRSLQRARGRRHRDHDRLRGARRGRRRRRTSTSLISPPGPPRRRRLGRRRAARGGARREAEVVELHETADDAPVVKLVNQIVAQAVEQGASDIHLAPDGQASCACASASTASCSDVTTVPRRMAAGVVSRVKIMAELDIAERRAAPGRPRRPDRRRPPRRPARRDAADACTARRS